MCLTCLSCFACAYLARAKYPQASSEGMVVFLCLSVHACVFVVTIYSNIYVLDVVIIVILLFSKTTKFPFQTMDF